MIIFTQDIGSVLRQNSHCLITLIFYKLLLIQRYVLSYGYIFYTNIQFYTIANQHMDECFGSRGKYGIINSKTRQDNRSLAVGYT